MMKNKNNGDDDEHLLRIHSHESKVRPLEKQLSCLRDGFMTGKKREDDSLLRVHVFSIGARWHF